MDCDSTKNTSIPWPETVNYYFLYVTMVSEQGMQTCYHVIYDDCMYGELLA